MNLAGILLVLFVAIVVVFFFLSLVIRRLLYVSAPNEALVFSGAHRTLGDKDMGYRIVRGGRSMRVPLLEEVSRIDLTMFTIDVVVQAAYSKGGIPLNVHGVAQIKLPSEEPRLSNAVERFLGRSRGEIAQVARETLEGNVRGVLAQLTPEQVNQDKTEFARKLLEEAEHDMTRMGLVLDTLKIQNVTDDANYLNSTGRIQGARVRMEASIVEARTQAEAAEQKANNWAQSEIAKVDADLAISRQETDKRIKDAESRREAMIQEARGQVLAQIAQVKAEITRQKARALQVERQLDADVIQPQDAQRRMTEEQARGDAATIIETGRAEADALKRLIEEYRKAGPNAKQVLLLQQLIPLATDVSGAARPVKIKRLTFLPKSGGDGSFALKAIAASEQIRAATGLDLTDVARRLAAPAAAPAPKAPPKAT